MINMINGEGTCKAVVYLDSFDSLPDLRISQIGDGDVSSPSSRYSSCGESDFDRYCSANSALGTPSICSTNTVFDDFTEYDNSGLENFSLEERVDINSKNQRLSSTGASDSKRYSRTEFCSENIRTQQNLKCSSSGLELYGDNDDVLAMPMLDALDFMGTNKLENDLDQDFIHKDVEDSELSKGQKKLGGDGAGTAEKYLFDDVDGKCSQSVPTIGGESEYNGHESNMQTGEMKKTLDNSSTSEYLSEKCPVVSKIEDFELREFYDDVVHEMEEILLDSVDSTGSRLAHGNRMLEPQLSMHLRDGRSTATTSGTGDACLPVQPPMRIDWVEVVGARQKKGDVSLSKRMVGVKEYTMYKIKVSSGEDQWEIERRYRDFLTLYRCMKTLFTEQGRDLPSPWYNVEKETKKIFGSASPGVIVQRSVLLQECLQSILHITFLSSPPSAIMWFLSPPSALVSNSSFARMTINRNNFSSGKTISLIVDIPPCKSMKQMLEAQHNCCAGCHKHFDDGKTLIWDFVQTFGWGKPRLCEYTGKLFCSSCHTNETAVLPARVLHHWDFTRYPVCQLAKSYLDSINDQPMLCITAVNPILLLKVPVLLHVMSVRKKIQMMLPYVICPFRRSINRGLGTRRYLLESNDYFALKDLIDLSKGAFAALPVMVETLSRKILKHITDQCSTCCDVGLPCSARQNCRDPCSLIFPFQEDEVESCTACQSVYHKPCFRKLALCSCGHPRLTRVSEAGRSW